MHAYLGHDGRPPGEFLAIARDEVRSYGGEIIAGRVTTVSGSVDAGFTAVLADGASLTGRRVLIATGLVDELPEIPGLREQWGHGVLHCPYCHGWEVRDQRIVLIATGPMSAHQALLFRQLSEHVTVVEHEPNALGAERRRIAARGVRIEPGPVAEVVADEVVRGVRVGERLIAADAVVVAPRFVARADAVRSLGVALVPIPMGNGESIEADDRGETTVPGVYAAGNAADASHQVLQAAANGGRAGAMINADLAGEEADRALATPGDTAEHWDTRYATTEQWWSGHANHSLVVEASGLPPGTALDVGCGEGGDAVWLAQRGWQVTGLDISQVALDRVRKTAAEAGVEIATVCADVADPPPLDRYDLVTVHYPALRKSPGNEAIRALLDAVAPGGRLLVVGHDLAGADHLRRHGIDPDEYVQPSDVARLLDDAWTVEVNEIRDRVAPPGHDSPHVRDVVLRARRSPEAR
jgi:thioredoxin reductase/SAM-dependent methyltransferase